VPASSERPGTSVVPHCSLGQPHNSTLTGKASMEYPHDSVRMGEPMAEGWRADG
jgi:hypothetical protein